MSKICKDKKGQDKYAHAFFSFVIGVVIACLLSTVYFSSPLWPSAITFVSVTLVGIGKEIIDSFRKDNHFCIWDLLADAAGALPSAILAYVVNYYVWAV